MNRGGDAENLPVFLCKVPKAPQGEERVCETYPNKYFKMEAGGGGTQIFWAAAAKMFRNKLAFL